MKCPKCQHENPRDSKFCFECGQRLELKCSQCGKALPIGVKFCNECGQPFADTAQKDTKSDIKTPALPSSLADSRYQIKELIGEGGKKKVYLAYDALLDRDVAISLLKTEGMDEASRVRITREAQAMGRLGSHQNIVTVHDFGEENGQSYIVSELMQGDVADLIEKADDHRLPIEQVIDIASSICQGLQYAHDMGIIHRDLKPGNVFVAADGSYKIGDFGLALVDDYTRLTQSDGVLGTFLYCSPEQSTGGEVSARSDLYSLGTMIYEMATGRPPFIGDDSVAIIGQHLNAAPVDPSFHRPTIPRAFETLIVGLLEKNPQKRPVSASNVINVLQPIKIELGKAIPEPEVSIDVSPIYRQVFVGREKELKQLKDNFDHACAGRGSLAMVIGEPGIGKTVLCEELTTYVGIRGGQNLTGHCYEEGSISLPYLAFVEAMRSYVLESDPNDLNEAIGSGGPHVGRIVPEIRDKLDINLQECGDPEEERYQLMQSVASFLSNAANMQPILIILEDLHDADQGTLDMLTFIARSLSSMRVMIVGNYRDVEVDRKHPLSRALAELRRIVDYDRVLLRGLNADEVQRMLSAIIGQDMPWRIAEDVYRSTEGNPLFVREVIRHLVEEGQIKRKDGRWQGLRESDAAMRIPEGLRDVIGKRLSLLSLECNELLSIAAVIGRDFGLHVLKTVTDIPEDVLHRSLEEAKGTYIVEEREGVGANILYRFTHAFFRQILYEEMIAPKRIKVHQQIARAIESINKGQLEGHASELSGHFSHSSDPADLSKAVRYSEMAADNALSVFAFGEAVRLIEQAIKVQEVLAPSNSEKKCDLLTKMAEARLLSGDPRHVLDVDTLNAFNLAKDIGDDSRASKICTIAFYALSFYGAGPAMGSSESAMWAAAADQYAKEGTIQRAIADAMAGVIKRSQGLRVEGIASLNKAIDLARRLEDPETLHIVGWLWTYAVASPQHVKERIHIAEELSQKPHIGISTRTYCWSLQFRLSVALESGDRERADEIIDEIAALADRTKQTQLLIASQANNVLTATLDGDLEKALDDSRQATALSKELDAVEYAIHAIHTTGLRPRIYLGKAHSMIQHSIKGDLSILMHSFYYTNVGQNDKAIEILNQFVQSRINLSPSENEDPTYPDIFLLDSAISLNHKEAVKIVLNRFADTEVMTTGIYYTTIIPLHLGAGAAMLGMTDEARSYYRRSLQIARAMRFRPELALSRYRMAELFFRNYSDERQEALEHLDFALKEFKEMKMQPFIEKAQALKGSL